MNYKQERVGKEEKKCALSLRHCKTQEDIFTIQV